MAHATSPLIDRAQRFPIVVLVHYRETGMAAWSGGASVNISRTGILFCADRTIPAGSVLDVEFVLEGAKLSFQGSVVRSSPLNAAVKFHRHAVSRALEDYFTAY